MGKILQKFDRKVYANSLASFRKIRFCSTTQFCKFCLRLFLSGQFDCWNFNEIFRKNIAYGNVNATAAELDRAVNLAHLRSTISNLPHGYESRVMERGVGLSGGERLRVGIARSILANRRVLLLDEPTASLDAITAKIIQGTLETLASNKTTLIVAHNLASIVHVDQIVVLDNGRIVEMGK